MENPDAGPSFVMVSVADSPDTRLFIELSSYASDLAEARRALDLAIQGLEEGSLLADACQHLIAAAVVAYCRTVLRSKVRVPLTAHVDIPDDLLEVHDQVKSYRNRTIAHSQSELAVTYAVGVLDSGTLGVRHVMGLTGLTPLPRRLVREFGALIDAMECRLGEVIDPVRARLAGQLAEMDRSCLEAAASPELVEKWADEFNPKTTRSPYPIGHTVYWEALDDDGATRPE